MFSFRFKARGPGFEPRYSPSKGDVLPLDDPRALNLIKCYVYLFVRCGIHSGNTRHGRDVLPLDDPRAQHTNY